MLDIYIHNGRNNAKPFNQLTEHEKAIKRKKGRLYHCLISGITWHHNEDMYFLTLTSLTSKKKHLMGSWKLLVKYIHYNYGKFEFCCVETSEGNGVLHIIFTGSRLDINDIRAYWKKLTGAPQMVIKWVKKGDFEKVAAYMLAQYVAGQQAYVRHTSSKNWVYPGYRDDFMFLKRKLGYQCAIAVWDETMQTHHAVGQVNFDGTWAVIPTERKQMRKETTISNNNKKYATRRPVRGLRPMRKATRRLGCLYHLPYIQANRLRMFIKKVRTDVKPRNRFGLVKNIAI